MITTTLPLTAAGSDATLDLYCVTGNKEMGFDRPRPAILVIPGGGYRFVSEREAEPIALRFVTHGWNAAVLRYSVPEAHFPQQLKEAAAAMALLRERGPEWNVDPHRIAACGFSAGGHLALSLGVHWDKSFLTEAVGKAPEVLRPDALVLCYPVVTNDERYFHAYETADKYRVPVLFHAWLPSEVEAAMDVAKRWPNVPIILGHAGMTAKPAAKKAVPRFPILKPEFISPSNNQT